MKKIKPWLFLSGALFIVILIIPSFLVIPFTKERPTNERTNQTEQATTEPETAVEVAVYRSKYDQIANLPLEEYIKGVVAAEMPAEFELEALKAQALTARTYIVKQILNPKKMGVPDGAIVTDTVMHQVYKSPKELKEIWGADYQWKMERITKAVNETKGKIITYNGEPITASFFSTSNGFTENSEDYWQNSFPYLRSVKSPWDKNSPKFIATKRIPLKEFEQKLGVNLSGSGIAGTIIERTEGNRVAKVQISGKQWTGREIRETLGLNSSDFTWKQKGNFIEITTKGWGHGVGMSQYGAHGMAQQGKTVKEIITHYYRGTSISEIDLYENKLMVRK